MEAQYRGESPFFDYITPFPLDGISLSLPPLRTSGTGRHAASVMPFVHVRPGSSFIRHYGGRVLHLSAENSSFTHQRSGGCQPIAYNWLLGDVWTLLACHWKIGPGKNGPRINFVIKNIGPQTRIF